LSFSWDVLDASATGLDRLRETVYDLGEPGQVDGEWMDRFVEPLNDDLNIARALGVAWDLTRSDLSDADKKATILRFDDVLGLNLGDWAPAEVPAEVLGLAQQRQAAREARNWAEADALRDKITEAGYEVRDTPEGPVVRKLE
jgi:cysteinyl-tRNA synthetase